MSAMTTVSALDAEQIERLLQAARQTITKVRYCWLATQAENGGANARAVRVFAGAEGGDEWSRRFVCRSASRKVLEIGRDPRVTLAYQDDTGDNYVALGGIARAVADRAEMRELWPTSADKFFPPGFADANMILVRVDVDRIEIHARGITGEPFGHGRTLIERRQAGGWRFVPA
jgi:general stress protein 26